jgi:ABC-type sugar transport system ATPase subunit
MPEIIRVEKITKRYGDTFALKGASFSLQAGEVHALMGENGAGKSTMSKIIAGAVRPNDGTIFLDGESITIHSPRDAQKFGIGIIYQELDLFPHLTAGENIVIGNLHYPEGSITDTQKIDAFCKPFFEQVGLDCNSRKLVTHLSI